MHRYSGGFRDFANYVSVLNQDVAGLEPGSLLPNYLTLGFICYKNLNASHFQLKERDIAPLLRLPPGKSGFVYFSHDIDETCCATLGRHAHSDDYIHTISSERIVAAGWIAYYAPTPVNPLHVRFSPKPGRWNGGATKKFSDAECRAIAEAGWVRVGSSEWSNQGSEYFGGLTFGSD